MEEIKNIRITISSATLVKVLVILAIALAVYFLRSTILVLLTAVVVASAVDPAASWFGRLKVPRVLAVLLVYLIAFSIIAGTLFFFVPPLFEDISDFAFNIPAQINTLINDNPTLIRVIPFSQLQGKGCFFLLKFRFLGFKNA